MSSSKEETKRNSEVGKRIIKASLRDDGVLVESVEDIERLCARGYGIQRNGELLLTFYEAMYLCSKGLIEIKDEETGETVGFQDLLKRYETIEKNAWVKYLIYRDLRSRGYVVREGFGPGVFFRLYERGEYTKDSADYLVYGIYEGMPLSIEDLSQVLKFAQNLKKTLILAVINRRGEIVYYSLSNLTF
ncbi:MAG: tRNA-intron lyase [Candidatus Bathyarchaeia archaeon]|nr:tRNA-intron lyase [Candidatus Bathyarchaeota archaeon]